MKRVQLILLIIGCLLPLDTQAQSVKESYDLGWQFHEGDIAEVQKKASDDQDWLTVNLPHDWDIYHTPDANAPTSGGGGYYPGGIGWYRKTLDTDKVKLNEGEQIILHFEGVYQHCQVYANGVLAGTHAYGYTPFKIDLTPYIKSGKKMDIAVKVDNAAQPNCRWYSGSGIYRHVWLERYKKGATDNPDKLFVRTEKINGISADGLTAESATVRISYEGKPDEIRELRNVKLWSPEHPYLYTLEVGALRVQHGFRTFCYDAKRGATLNGLPILINGACVHHDNGILGAMAFDAAEVRKVRLMKEAGFNLIRTSHNLQTTAFLNACDSLGMMVIDEAFDGWYSQKTEHDYHEVIDSCYSEDLTAMVLRDRNHPSIIAWSIGNEVMERKELRVVHTARKFKSVIRTYDNTRPVTEALCSWDKDWEIFDPHAEVLDIVGYNYMMHKAESDHERCPERVMWQTESYPRDAFVNWKHTVERPYIIGDIVWTGLDYLGESGIGQFYYEGEPRGEHYQGQHFPFHGAYCGDVDMTGWRKPISHYREMLWNANAGDNYLYMAVREPDLYTNGTISETAWSVWPTWESWNWRGWEGKPIDVEIYTKAPKVSLYLNDQFIETKAVNLSTEFKAVFTLPYAPGTLRAVALDEQGTEKAATTLTTADAPYSIRLTPESGSLKADGESISFIQMEIIDKKGNIVTDNEMTATVKVSGAATLLAAASANFKDLEPTTSPRVTTYKGRALIVVRNNGKRGTATISVTDQNANVSGKCIIKAKE